MSKKKIPKQYYIVCDICGEKITNTYFNKRHYYEFIVDEKKPFKTRTLDICSSCYMQMEYWIQRRRDKDKKEKEGNEL